MSLTVNGMPQARQSGATIEVTPVGSLVRTQHRVSGEMYIFNQTLLILDGFTFDGLGAGVYINIGKIT